MDASLFQTGRTLMRQARQFFRMPGPGYADYAPQVRALAKAAPQRLLWGTNWPHPLVETKPDDADLLDSLGAWIAEESLRRAVLVENPAELYGFPPVGGGEHPQG